MEIPERTNQTLSQLKGIFVSIMHCFQLVDEINRLEKLQDFARKNPSLFTNNKEYFLEFQRSEAAVVVSYARLFSSGTGLSRIDKKSLPEELLATHHEIINLRNEKHAHFESHSSLTLKFDFEETENGINLIPKIITHNHFHDCPKWRANIEWLIEHLNDRQQQCLLKLKKLSGVDWRLGSSPLANPSKT